MQPDHSRARSSAVGPTGVTPASGPRPPPPPPVSMPDMHAAANNHDMEMTRQISCIDPASCNRRTTAAYNPHQEHRTRDLECVDHDRVMTHPRGKPCNAAVNFPARPAGYSAMTAPRPGMRHSRAMALRLGGLSDVDPAAVPLPPGTEVVTRVARMVDGELRPGGATGRVASIADAGRIEVVFVDGRRATYLREELTPRKLGVARYARRRQAAWDQLHGCIAIDTLVGSRAWGVADEAPTSIAAACSCCRHRG